MQTVPKVSSEYDRDKQEKTKILIISSLGPPPYLGGIENVLDTLLKSTLKENYIFSILDTYRKPDPRRSIASKIVFALSLPFRCTANILKFRPKIVHIHFCSKVDFWKHSICLLTSKFLGVKTIFHLHGGSFDTLYRQYPSAVQTVVRFILSQANILIALSDYWRSFLASLTRASKIRIVSNPINCTELSSFSSTNPDPTNPSVVLLGSLGKRKGHYDVLKAAPVVLEQHPDVHFYFAGLDEDFGATEALKNIALNAGIAAHIHFLGPVSGEAKLRLLGTASIVILPSYGENMPISVLEGMAAGKPVIASKVGAIPEVILDGVCGLLVDPGDWQSLANKLNICFENKAIAKQLGEEAKKRVRDNWDVNKLTTVIHSVYQECI